jgi:predicted O-linked N-acetylglucosamine transferase (SPINDLY family)
MLKNGHVTFGSLNQPAKFNERVLSLWSRLLLDSPGSRLLLNINAPGSSSRRIIEFMQSRGIPPDRLELLPRQPWQEYLAAYHRIDVSLDPFPFSGHTTSCDALWMGVPVITLPGQTYASRTCTSLLKHLSLDRLIAQTEDDYVRIARELVADTAALSELRASIRQRMTDSIITHAAEFTKHLESAFRQAWRTWCERP